MSLAAPYRDTTADDPDALYFVPLGGAGEIGMNLNVYGYRGQWLIVDCGVTFGDEEHQPGVNVIMADPAFIVGRRDRLLGIVATHAHEDHIGAIPYLWPQLECPVWATPFTASVLRAKLVEAGLADRVRLTTVPMSGRFQIGPFDLELISRFAARKLNAADLLAPPLNEMLLVVNCPQGFDRYQTFTPQLMTPAGYCPLSG